ncbi:MAG: hypothetical protein RL226_481, partial [Bacteroidota bacterium]
MQRLSRIILSFVFLCLAWNGYGQFYVGSNQEFGKNRVQYRDFFWMYYPAERFDVYYYQGGKDLAEYTVFSVNENLKQLEERLDYVLEEKIQIILYNKQSEFRQSNIGITGDDQYNIGGSARIVGSKLFLYYTGDYISFERLINENLARVVFSQMMYGGDWKQVIKNNTLLSVPKWYEEGLLSYLAHPDDPLVNARIQDGILNQRFKKFNNLQAEESVTAGHALWSYIADVYGESVIPNILYMTRISRNIESGFLYVLGMSLETISADFVRYHQSEIQQRNVGKSTPLFEPITADEKVKSSFQTTNIEQQQQWLKKNWKRRLGELDVKSRKKYSYSQFSASPDGKYIAFVTHQMGQYKIWLYDKGNGKVRRILKRDHKIDRIQDETFPVLAWHPTSKTLTFVFEEKGQVFLGNYNLEDKKHLIRELFNVDKVVDMAYASDGRRMVLSGVKDGKTDLYLFPIVGNTPERLTFDIYDDLHPQFMSDGNTIIFASNRPDDTLRTDVANRPFDLETDIFTFNLNSRKLSQITNSPNESEFFPFEYDAKNYTFLSEKGNQRNRYIAHIDSTISRIDTTIHYRYFTTSNPLSNLKQAPVAYDYNRTTGEYSFVLFENGRNVFYDANIAKDIAQPSAAKRPETNSTPEVAKDYLIIEVPEQPGEVNINDYRFEDDETGVTYEKEVVTLTNSASTPAQDSAAKVFVLPKPRNYRLNFTTDYVVTQIDNSFSNRFYQQFSSPTSMFPGISGLLKLGISDLFEDYKIVGGYRFSGSLQNNDYGLYFENLKGRVDRKFQFMRQGSRQYLEQLSVVQLHTYNFEYQFRYPFHELLSLRGSLVYRLDRSIYLSTDFINLGRPNVFAHNVGARLEYVFDNTRSLGLNLMGGTRYKFWGEYYVDPLNRNSDFSVFGADIR